MLDQEELIGYSIWDHKRTPTYSKGRVCIVGDAAHTVSPYQGAGGGLAIEDALVLGHLLGAISSIKVIDAAFKAFDVVRRPRCQAVVDSSRATGQLLTGQDSQIGIGAVDMGKALGPLFEHIDALDLASHKQMALDEFGKQVDLAVSIIICTVNRTSTMIAS